MNLLDRVNQKVTVKKASTMHGGEYHGPCPLCGGNDRFHVWPEQGDYGTVWCRACGLGGDAIEYLIKVEGMNFRDAAKEVGKEISDDDTSYQAPRFRPPKSEEAFTPRTTTTPAELWVEHAGKLVDWSHQQLLANPEQLAWCAARGLDRSAVEKYRLGWNAGEKGKDLYRAREAWGLDTVLKDDGKTKKKLWLPIGLTIPFHQGNKLHRVRIRRPDGEPRYYLVPGSGTAPLFLGADRKAFVVVESELDALLIHHLAGDLVGVISNGNSTAKPDAETNRVLSAAMAILIALDSDDAGMQAAVWWKRQYPQADRHPVPVGKDPGEAYQAGVDLREWVKLGLPPVLTLPSPQRPPQAPKPTTATPAQDIPAPGPAEKVGATGEGAALVHTITAKDGREINITDDRAAYQRLVAAGKVVFDSKEIAYVRATGADQDTAARFIDMKEIFPWAKVTSGERLQP